MGSVAKSYTRKGFLIYEEMRKYFSIYEEAVSHMWLWNCSILNFLIYEENFLLFFISVAALSKNIDICENQPKNFIFKVKFFLGMWEALFDTLILWSGLVTSVQGVEFFQQLFFNVCVIRSYQLSQSRPCELTGHVSFSSIR